MSCYEPLLSVRFEVDMPDLPRTGETLRKGERLLAASVRSMGCIEDWRCGFVQVEPADRPVTILIPYLRVVDLEARPGPDTRPPTAHRFESIGASGRDALPLEGAIFRKDVPGVLPARRLLKAGTKLEASLVHSLRFARTLHGVVVVVPRANEKERTVALDDVLALVLTATEGDETTCGR